MFRFIVISLILTIALRVIASTYAAFMQGLRGSDGEVTCFLNNLGMGYQFAAAGAIVYRKAKEMGLGHELPTDWFTQKEIP